MTYNIDQILKDIELDRNDLRDFIYSIANQHLTKDIRIILNAWKKISSCSKCITANELDSLSRIQTNVIEALTLVNNNDISCLSCNNS